MKRKIALMTAGALLASTLLMGCGNSTETGADSAANSEYQKIELTMAVNGTDIQIDSLVADQFAKLVEERSGGNVTVAVFPNDQLAGGNATKGVEMVAVGSTDLAAYATCVMAALDSKLAAGTIPWIFNSYEEARTVIDETGYKYYEELLANKGITYLGSFHNGFRQISNSKHAVETPEDVKGLKIRVPGGEIYMDFWKTLKADPVAMSWSEVYTAIQQGTIDGQENGCSITDSAKMDEIQDYMTIWNYTYENDLFVANTEIWNSLEENTRELLSECAVEACNWGRDKLEADEENLIKGFEEGGMQVTRLNDEQLQTFKDAVEPMREKYIEKYGDAAREAFQID